MSRPCKTCPFRRDAPRGLWAADHYLRIAYLGSSDAPPIHEHMGCHQAHRSRSVTHSPRCKGWLIGARDRLPVRFAQMAVNATAVDLSPASVAQVMDPVEMAEVNGLDLSKLPALEAPRDEEAYSRWGEATRRLKNLLLDNPRLAYAFVLEGSPLAEPVTLEDAERILGFRPPQPPTSGR